MADEANVRFLILWENELRAAAQAFAGAHRLQDDETASDDDRAMAIARAMRLADLALHGADDEEATLLLSAPRDIFRGRPNASSAPQRGITPTPDAQPADPAGD